MIDKRLFQLPGIKSLFPMLAGLTVLQAFMILLQAKFLATALVISWQRQSLSHSTEERRVGRESRSRWSPYH